MIPRRAVGPFSYLAHTGSNPPMILGRTVHADFLAAAGHTRAECIRSPPPCYTRTGGGVNLPDMAHACAGVVCVRGREIDLERSGTNGTERLTTVCGCTACLLRSMQQRVWVEVRLLTSMWTWT